MLDQSANFVWNMLYGLEQRIFDLRFGVATAGTSQTRWDVSSVGGTNFWYQGAQWPAVSFALRDLKPTSSDVFVDLGSGKGKALLMAARLPYRRVVGVEIDGELVESAQNNLARDRRRSRAGSVEMEVADILDWPIPDDATTIFMFNPFFGETFHAALEKVFDSYEPESERPARRLRIPVGARLACQYRPRSGGVRASLYLAAAAAMVGAWRSDHHLPRDRSCRAVRLRALPSPSRKGCGRGDAQVARTQRTFVRGPLARPFPCGQSRVQWDVPCTWTSAVRAGKCRRLTSSSRCTTSLT